VPSVDSLVLRRASILTAGVGVICTVIGALMFGSKGLLAGILGTVIAVAFFATGQYIVGKVLRTSPETAMMTALVVYLGQILLLLQDATFFAPKVFASTIIACTLAWIFTAAFTSWNTKVLYVDQEGPK